MPHRAHTEVYEQRGGGYRWRLRAANGEIVADSAESYPSAEAASEALTRVERLMLEAAASEGDEEPVG